jgi:predicted lipase
LKFTTDGYLGVVAGSFDINFSYEKTAGRLVNSVGKVWDETFVLIFPLTKDILNGRKKTDIETAVGNYLIDKGVPIIDFYSHNY